MNASLLCEKAAHCLIPTLWQLSGKGEIMETFKDVSGWPGLKGWGRIDRRMCMAMGILSVLLQ